MTTTTDLDTRRAEGLAVLGDLPPEALDVWTDCHYGAGESPAQLRRLYLAVRPLASSDRAAMTEAVWYAVRGISEVLRREEEYARSATQALDRTRAVIENLRRGT